MPITTPTTTTTIRRVAAGSALALAASGSAFFAAPAMGATSQTLSYTCKTSLGDKTLTASHEMAETVPYGGTVDVTSTVTVPEDVSGPLYAFLDARKVEGTLHSFATTAAGGSIQVDQAIPSTDVPPTGPMTLVADGGASLAPFAPFTPAGTTVPVLVQDRKAQDGTTEVEDAIVNLNITNSQGDTSAAPPIKCELADGQDLAVGSVTIVQAVTESAPAIGYAKKAHKVVGKVTVDAPESGVAPAGSVKLILKKGKKTVGKPQSVALTDGKAVAKWQAPKKGAYRLIAKYAGDANFEGSKAVATKRF